MTTKRVILNTVASVLILGIGYAGVKYLLNNSPKATQQKPTISGLLVDTIQLRASTHDIIIPAIATVEASQKASLSTKVAGKLIFTSPSLTPGQIVKKGELLAQIDPSDYEVAVAQIEAQLRSAKATELIEKGQQASALKELELSGLNPSGLNRSLILREPQLAQVEASIANLEASRKMAQYNLMQTRILAPYTGVITKKSAELGNYISSQSVIAEVVATDAFWMYANIPSAYLPFLNTLSEEKLSSLHVSLFANNKKLSQKARILKVLPELDTLTKQTRVLLRIEDPLQLGIKASQSPDVLLQETLSIEINAGQSENLIALPLKYLRANNNVWLMNKENKLTIKPVEVMYKNADVALLKEGISEDDKVITTYLSAAVEGTALVDMKTMKKAKKGE